MSEAPGDTEPALGTGDPDATGRYLAQVMAEIDEEVQRRRNSGDLPQRVERELDELFLRFSPMGGRDGSLAEALGVVESTGYIDPVVPVLSSKTGGAVAKRAIRQASLWYVSWVTDQVNQFTTATARALRVLDDRVRVLQRQYADRTTPAAPILELPWAHRPGAWWVSTAVGGPAPAGRAGSSTPSPATAGWSARWSRPGWTPTGSSPAPGGSTRPRSPGSTCARSRCSTICGRSPPRRWPRLVLSGVVDGMTAAERDALVRQASLKLAPAGRLVVHSLSEAGWSAPDAPIEADLASGRPLRPRTWVGLLERLGFDADVVEGPERLDYLVVATAPDPGEGRRGGG